MTVIDINDRLEEKKQSKFGEELSVDITALLNSYLEQGMGFDTALITLAGLMFKNIDGAREPEHIYYFLFKRLRGIE